MNGQVVAVGVAVASSTAMRSDLATGIISPNSRGNLSVLSPNNTRSQGYATAARLDAVASTLSERDWAVMRSVGKLRLLTGKQLERLHFTHLADVSRPVVRRRVLRRLVLARVLATLERRVGGVRAGSDGLIYYLGTAGQRLVATDESVGKIDRPGERYVRHVLAVSSVYVALTEAAASGSLRLDRFEAEPASWWPDGRGGLLKPDGYLRVSSPYHFDSWWLEVDLATEHLPTLKRKLAVYTDFYRRGQLGPDDVMPLVVVTVPNAKRCSEIDRLIRQSALRESELFTVVLHNDAADLIMRRLNQP